MNPGTQPTIANEKLQKKESEEPKCENKRITYERNELMNLRYTHNNRDCNLSSLNKELYENSTYSVIFRKD
jgi:hypothetical protein